jgi:hypothetical protein
MWPLGAAGRRGLLDSGELATGIDRGRAREGPTGHWRSVSWVGRGRGDSGGGAHRQPAAVTAVNSVAARQGLS